MEGGQLGASVWITPDEQRTAQGKARKGRMEMFGLIAKGFTALVLAVTITAAVGTKPVAAASGLSMGCGVGTETVSFSLPMDGPGRQVIYAYSVNGGAWQWTPRYYVWQTHAWILQNNQWVYTNGGLSSFVTLGGGKTVVAYGFETDAYNNWKAGVRLGPCTTSSFFTSGINIYNR